MVAKTLRAELPCMAHDRKRYDLEKYDETADGVIKLYDQLYDDYNADLESITDKKSAQYTLGLAVLTQAKLIADKEKAFYTKRGTFDRTHFLQLNEALYRCRLLKENPSNLVNLLDMNKLAQRLPGKKSRAWKILATLLIVAATLAFVISFSILTAGVPIIGGGAAFLVMIAAKIGPSALAALWAASGAITSTIAAGAAGTSAILGTTVSATAFTGMTLGAGAAVQIANYKWELAKDRSLSRAISDLTTQADKDLKSAPKASDVEMTPLKK